MKLMQRLAGNEQMAKTRSLWVFLSLAALFVSVLPAPAWACPVTGRMGDSKLVCRAPGNLRALKCCGQCAKAGGKCCKPISLPPLLNNEDDPRDHNLKIASTSPLDPPVLIGLSAFVAVNALPSIFQTLSLVPIPTASPPPLFSNLLSAPLASRAPPVSLLS